MATNRAGNLDQTAGWQIGSDKTIHARDTIAHCPTNSTGENTTTSHSSCAVDASSGRPPMTAVKKIRPPGGTAMLSQYSHAHGYN